MPYQDYADGVYLAAQASPKGGFAHFGALDVGNCLQIPGADGTNPIIVHQCPPRIRAGWLYDTGTWQLLAVEIDAIAARQRYMAALTVPEYYVLRHNCEHFRALRRDRLMGEQAASGHRVAGRRHGTDRRRGQ